MTARMEDLLRDSLQRQAARAVPPEQVLAGLPDRAGAGRGRRRWTGAAVAASALAVAGVLTATAMLGPGNPAAPGNQAAPGGQAGTGSGAGNGVDGQQPGGSANPPAAASVPLRYDLGWVPAGYQERSRSAQLDSGLPVRMWTRHPLNATFDTGGQRIELYIMKPEVLSDEGELVVINGKSGRYINAGTKGYVQWLAEPGIVVTVSQHASLPKAELLRIARSVRPSTEVLPVTVTAGWLPQGLALNHTDITGNSATAFRLQSLGIDTTPPDPSGPKEKLTTREFSVTLGATTDAPAGGQAVTIGGKPGRYVVQDLPEFGDKRQFVVVTLGPGQILTLSGYSPWTRAELLRVAENLHVGPSPDVSWLGTP